jgi:hypothetical protein
MKRPSSAPRSYLQQLAAPLPQTAALLYARRPVARGAGSLLDAIPPIVDSVDSVETFDGHTGVPDLPTDASSPRNPSLHTPHGVLPHVRSASPPLDVQRDATSVPVVPASARPATASSHVEDVTQPATPRSSLRHRSAATGQVAPERSSRLDPEPQLLTAALRPSFAEPSSPPFASAKVNAEAKRGRGVQVHIGTVEVRVAAPGPRLPQPSPNQRGDTISNHTGRPAHAEPLSRGLAWSHGLVQG